MPDPIADEPVAVTVTARETVFDGRIWNVVRESFDYNGSSVTRELVDHPGAVAVLAMDDEDRVLLIQQYRHPIRSREWEIPAGLLDIHGEPKLAAAKRELAEEVDLEATEWFPLVEFATTAGGSNERVQIFLARGVSSTSHDFVRVDEEADIIVRWVALDDVVAAVLDGTISNSILMLAALTAHASRATGWRSLG